MIQIRIILIIKLLAVILNFSYSQTKVITEFGLEYSKFTQQDNPQLGNYEILDQGYSVKYLVYGIGIEKFIANKVSLDYNLSYARPQINMADNSLIIFKVNGFQYHEIRNRISLNYYIHQWAKLSFGAAHHYLDNIRLNIGPNIKSDSEFLLDKSQFSLKTGIGGLLGNFELNLFYSMGIYISSFNVKQDLFKPVNSLSLALRYKFDL